MPTEYFIDEALNKSVDAVVTNVAYTEFGPLRENDIAFLCAFLLKTNKDGEEELSTGEPVTVKRITPADRVFLQAHYKVYVDQYWWNNTDEVKLNATLHRALMRIELEKTKDGLKFGTRKPDVVEFQATVTRFGAWTESLCELRTALEEAQAKKMARRRPTVPALEEQPG